MCNRYDSERAAEQEMLEVYVRPQDIVVFGANINEIEERRLGSAHREIADAKAEIDVDTDVWEAEGGTAL